MANGSVTSTGLPEMRAAIDAFPAAEEAALKDVAHQTALREQSTARALLRGQQKTSAHALADAIEVVEDLPHKRYLVISQPPADQPANVPIWNEFGTRYLAARPYMRPANDTEQDRYRRDMEAASADAAAKTFKD